MTEYVVDTIKKLSVPKELSDNMFRYNVLLIGDKAVGKTALRNLLSNSKSVFDEEYGPTTKMAFSWMEHSSKQPNVSTSIREITNFDIFKCIFDFRTVIIMYDITSRKSFNKVEKFIEEVKKYGELTGQSIQYIIIGNKTDCGADRKVFIKELHAIAKTCRATTFETSMKEDENNEIPAIKALIHKWHVRMAGAGVYKNG